MSSASEPGLKRSISLHQIKILKILGQYFIYTDSAIHHVLRKSVKTFVDRFQQILQKNRKKNIRFILPTREVSFFKIKSAGKRMWISFTLTLAILSRDCLQEVTETSDFCC